MRSLSTSRSTRNTDGTERNQKRKRPVRPDTVFLSIRLADIEYIEGLTKLLTCQGYNVITGAKARRSVSNDVLARIRTCDLFLSVMTRDEQKQNGDYTASAWLLEEKGAAVALGKSPVIMVEDGVTEIGGLQGDWQLIHFSQKSFLRAAFEAVDQLNTLRDTPVLYITNGAGC